MIFKYNHQRFVKINTNNIKYSNDPIILYLHPQNMDKKNSEIKKYITKMY